MSPNLRRVCCALGLVLVPAHAASGQQPPPRHGRIVDLFGEGVPAAEIRIHPEQAPHVVLARGRTDGLGHWRLRVPDRPDLVVRARARGFAVDWGRLGPGGSRLELHRAVTVRGVLRNLSGEPVPGVVVRGAVERAGRWLDEFVTTAADGSFTVRDLSCGQAVITAVVPGEGICTAVRHLIGDADVQLTPPPLADRDTNLTVTVNGLPFDKLSQARVRVTSHGMVLPAPLCDAPLDAFGVAMLPELPAAKYRLRVDCPGVRVLPRSFELPARFRDEDVAFWVGDLVAPATPVTVEVKDVRDRPLAGIEVRMQATDGSAVCTRGETDAAGRATMTAPAPSGELVEVEICDDRWACTGSFEHDRLRGWRYQRMLVKRGVPLRLQVAPANELRGAVRFSDGRPAGDVAVELWTVDGSDVDELVACTRSDASGRYRLARLPAYPDALRVVAADLAGVGKRDVEQLGGGAIDVATLELQPAASVRGVVADGVGSPLPGLHVWLTCRVSDCEPVGRRRFVVTDVHGRYAFVGLAPGEHELVVTEGEAPKNDRGQRIALPVGARMTHDVSH